MVAKVSFDEYEMDDLVISPKNKYCQIIAVEAVTCGNNLMSK